jgi:hypothetical protein
MMSGFFFRESVETLADLIGDPKTSAENLDAYARQCMDLPPENLADLRYQLITVITGLARVDTLLADYAESQRIQH